jgi:hypothetical protein
LAALAVLALEAGLVSAQAPGHATAAPADATSAPPATNTPAFDHGSAAGASAASSDTLQFSAEYLLWRERGSVPAGLRGVFVGSGFDADSLLGSLPQTSWRSGFRIFADYVPADDSCPVFELGGFFFEHSGGAFNATVVSHPAVAPARVPAALILQPVINGVIDVADSRGIVDTPIPGPNGSVDLDPADMLTSHIQGTSKRELWGLEANVRSRTCAFGCVHFAGLLGFRNVNLKEKLDVRGDFTFAEPGAGGDADEAPNNPENGHTNIMHTFDHIDVRNNFYGGQIGVTCETFLCERIVLSGFAKLAIGGNVEKVTQSGLTTLDATTIEAFAGGPFVPRPTTVLPGGLFTAQIPGGLVTHATHLAVMPDLNVNLGYLVTPNVQAYVGYNYMFLSNVSRLGSQALGFGGTGQSHLELHGFDVGLEFRF